MEPVASDEAAATRRFTWTVAIEPKESFALPFKPLAPVLKLAFGEMAADGERYFARHLTEVVADSPGRADPPVDGIGCRRCAWRRTWRHRPTRSAR